MGLSITSTTYFKKTKTKTVIKSGQQSLIKNHRTSSKFKNNDNFQSVQPISTGNQYDLLN